MIKSLEDIRKQIALAKKRKEDFFVQMENHKIFYLTNRSVVAYMIMAICFLVVVVMFSISIIKEDFNTPVIITISVFFVATLGAMIFYVALIFLKNSLQFKLGKLSSGLKGFAMLVVPIYLLLLSCYILIPTGREVITYLFTAVTTISAAILTIMGVHYTLVQQKNERIDKNNLVFELYENSDTESEYTIKNGIGDIELKLKIKNVSNNFGYFIGLYKICGCDVYQIGDKFPYFAISPNLCIFIKDIRINNGDDQLILVYKDIGENFYYLLLSIKGDKICDIEDAGKCDFEFLQNQIIETDETEKAVNLNNKIEIATIVGSLQSEKEDTNKHIEEIDISKRKEETKPNRTLSRDGFELIVSEEGEITDFELLTDLRKERLRLAKEKKIKPYMIFNNQQLVALATYKPDNEISFISIYSLGKKKYDLYGKAFIQIIKNYEECKGAA